MKLLLTGSSGRIGRAIFGALAPCHEVVGLDRSPFITTRHLGDIGDRSALRRAMRGVDAIIHTASLHAPHVGCIADQEFVRINVDSVRSLLQLAVEQNVRTVIYTSTTALYGRAVQDDGCTWIDAGTEPQPKTIYHRTKLQAEQLLEQAAGPHLAIRILRMSRCFPEQVDQMAIYRLHRGIDVRDVADAHRAALHASGAVFQRYIVSGQTPFRPEDTATLARDPRAVLALRCPDLLEIYDRLGWPLPDRVDRVYDPAAIEQALGWRSRYGFQEVLHQHRVRSIEVLPRAAWHRDPAEVAIPD